MKSLEFWFFAYSECDVQLPKTFQCCMLLGLEGKRAVCGECSLGKRIQRGSLQPLLLFQFLSMCMASTRQAWFLWQPCSVVALVYRTPHVQQGLGGAFVTDESLRDQLWYK